MESGEEGRTAVIGRSRTAVHRKLVWILGSPRSGSTWLMRLLDHPPRVTILREPLVGLHLGAYPPALLGMSPESAAGRTLADFRPDDSYFFSARYADVWLPHLQRLLLARLEAQIPRNSERCVVNEPNGSDGAEMIMRALPKASLIFLLRDGRDVVDSLVDAWREGSWLEQAFGVSLDASVDRLTFVRHEAYRWVARTMTVRNAFEAHPPERRCLVRYEELREDPVGVLDAVFRHFGWKPPAGFEEHVQSLSFEQRPSGERGTGTFHRAATPGLWRRNLTDEEAAACAKVMGPLLREFGYRE